MTNQTPFIIINRNFDSSSNPIGFVDLDDGNIRLKVNPKEKVTVDDINKGKFAFAPSYLVSKETNGIVEEVLVDSFSLVKTK